VLNPPLSFLWFTFTIELWGMVTVELPKGWMPNDWWWGMLLMGTLTLLHSRGPLLLGLGVLLDLLLHHLHHLLILLHHLRPHITIRIEFPFGVLVSPWPATSSSFSRHFALTVIYKSK